MERAASIAEHLATSAESPSALATGLCGRTPRRVFSSP